jgi:Protein of unknown function (DUF2752)
VSTWTATGRPRPGPDGPGRMSRPAAGALAAGAAAACLYFANPHTHQVFLPCPFRLLTGLYCPLCGGLRMVHDLLHGQLARAFHDNALAMPIVAFAGLAWLNLAIGCWRGRPVVAHRPRWLWPAVVAVLVAWTVVRNLPFGVFAALRP